MFMSLAFVAATPSHWFDVCSLQSGASAVVVLSQGSTVETTVPAQCPNSRHIARMAPGDYQFGANVVQGQDHASLLRVYGLALYGHCVGNAPVLLLCRSSAWAVVHSCRLCIGGGHASCSIGAAAVLYRESTGLIFGSRCVGTVLVWYIIGWARNELARYGSGVVL